MESVEEDDKEPPCKASAAVTFEEQAVGEWSVIEKHYYQVGQGDSWITTPADNGDNSREGVGSAKRGSVRVPAHEENRGARQQQKHCPRYPKSSIGQFHCQKLL